MAVSTTNIGRYRSDAAGPDPDYATLSGGTLTASSFGPVSNNLWVTKFRTRAGRSGASTPALRMALYSVDSAGNPTTRLGYSTQVNASTSMVDASTGAFIEAATALVDSGPTNTAIPVTNGTKIAIAQLYTGASANVGMIAAGSLPGAYDYLFYNRTGLSQPPPAPYGSLSTSYEGVYTLSAEAHINEAPRVPVNRTPGNTNPLTPSTINTLVPDFGFDFRDRNGAWGPGNDGFNDGDYMRGYWVELRRVSDNALMWNLAATASGAEQTANRATPTYAGSSLARGVDYKWRCKVSDYFSEQSDWSDWLYFNVANLGFVTLAGNPTGKIETQQPTFDFTWTHQSALSTNAAQLQLYQGSTLVYTSPIITKTVANNATGTLTWAEVANPTNLYWGTSYQYAIRGRDTGNVWSQYSAKRSFNTNAAPSIPDSLAPAGGLTVTALPLLSFKLTDADDTTATGLTAFARITGPYAITNGAFPANVTGYTVGTVTGTTRTFTFDGTDGRTALGSGKLAITASTTVLGQSFAIFNDDKYPVVVGQTYTGRISVKTSNVNLTPRAQLGYYTAADVLIALGPEPDYTPTINVWSDRSTSSVAPATAAYCKAGISVFNDTANQTGNIWIDDVSIDAGMHYERTATYNSTSGKWEYQTVTADVPAVGTYTWDTYSYDGTLYSGARTTASSAVKSSVATFVYALGPTVSVTSPTNGATVTSNNPTITWTSSSQNRRIVNYYVPGTSTLVYSSGWNVTASTTYNTPAGVIHNLNDYEIEVGVEDSTPLQGFSSRILVHIAVTPPATPTGFGAIPIKVGNDPWETAIRLQWQASAESALVFAGWYLYRSDLGMNTPYKILTSPDDTSVIDPVPTSGVEYVYTLMQAVNSGADVVFSAAVTSTAQVNLQGVVLCDVNNPLTYRCVLDSVQSRTSNRIRDEQTYFVGANKRPLTFRSPIKYWEIPGSYKIVPPATDPDPINAIAQRKADVLDLEDQGVVMCYRDEQGTTINGCRFFDFGYDQIKFYPIFNFSVREEEYSIAVSLQDGTP
jgi:hypothetical protein